MRRRRFLAALAAGTAAVAGCSGGDGTGGDVDADEDNPWMTEDTTTEPPHTEVPPTDDHTTERHDDEDDDHDLALGEASIVDLATGDRTLALSPTTYRSDDGGEVRLQFVATASDEHPALVRATLENGNDFANTFRLRETPPFGPESELLTAGPNARAVRHLVPAAGHDLVENGAAIERGPDGFWRLQHDRPMTGPERVRLAPGESVTGEFALVGPAGATGFPLGRYEQSLAEGRTLGIDAWRTSAPGPTTDSRFAGVSVPDLPEQPGALWYHEADPGTEAYLRPAREHARRPADLRFTLVNHGREPLSGAHRRVYKLVDGEWYDVGPRMFTSILRVIAPGGRREFAVEACGCDGGERFGGGRYAVDAMYGFDDESGATAATAALFDLEGDRLELRPTRDATVVREGATVRVTTPVDENQDRATLSVRPATDAGGAERVIAEQLFKPWNAALRDGLAPFRTDGETDRVVVESHRNAVDRAVGGRDAVGRTVRYRGQAYEAVRGVPKG